MTKIIFLDIDGVLNSDKLWDKQDKEYKRTGMRPEGMQHEIDHNACLLLKDIIQKTESKIVISSTWRLNYYDFLVKFLGAYKIPVIDKTGKGCYDCVRGNEILTWMKNNEELIGYRYHEYKNYVILDDSTDMLYWQKDNFVPISNKTGLTKKYKPEIIRILNQ